MKFDDNGVCDACRMAEEKEKIDWKKREDELLKLLDKYRRNDGYYDCLVPGSGGKESAENTVKALAGYIVKIDKPSGAGSSKILRAEPFSVQVNMSNVSIVQAEWNRAYLNELEFFPESTYKDQVDASSGAFNIINKRRAKIGVF